MPLLRKTMSQEAGGNGRIRIRSLYWGPDPSQETQLKLMAPFCKCITENVFQFKN
jgi:hypothetical protein